MRLFIRNSRLSRAGCDLQQAFFFDTFQYDSEVPGFELRYRLMTNRRENVIVQAGKQAGHVVFRPCLVAFMPAQRHGLDILNR